MKKKQNKTKIAGVGHGKGGRKSLGGWRQGGAGAEGWWGTPLLAQLRELQGTIGPQVQCDGHSARLRLMDQSRLMPGSHQAVSAQHRACASTLCLPVGQAISRNTL